MTKLKLLLLGCLLILLKDAASQSYEVNYFLIDADSSLKKEIGLKEKFASQLEARSFITTIPTLLQTRGYITASVDSTEIDSTGASVRLFLGLQYKWAKINTMPGDEDILSAVRWPRSSFQNLGLDWTALKNWQEQKQRK